MQQWRRSCLTKPRRHTCHWSVFVANLVKTTNFRGPMLSALAVAVALFVCAIPARAQPGVATSSTSEQKLDAALRQFVKEGALRDGRRQRYRGRDGRRDGAARVRAVLHYKGSRQGHRPWTGDGLWDRQAEWRAHCPRKREEQGGDIQNLPATSRGSGGIAPAVRWDGRIQGHRNCPPRGGRKISAGSGHPGAEGPGLPGSRRRQRRDCAPAVSRSSCSNRLAGQRCRHAGNQWSRPRYAVAHRAARSEGAVHVRLF